MSESCNEAKKTLVTLGLNYEGIHDSPNDHVLFRKELAKEVRCPWCGASCYWEYVQGKKVLIKVLRHFQFIPCIKHMLWCKFIIIFMSQHQENRLIVGMMCLLSKNLAWKHSYKTCCVFERESCHLRMGLAMDGVNLFGLHSTKWST